jgi:hypothetical protein
MPSWRYARPLSAKEQEMAEAYLRFTTVVAIGQIGRYSNLLYDAIGESYLALCFAVLDHGEDKDRFKDHLVTKVRGAVGKAIRNSRPMGYRRNRRLSKAKDSPRLFGSESYDFRDYPGTYREVVVEE